MSESDGYVLLALFLLPLGAALLLMLTPSRERAAIIALTGLSSLVMFVLSVYVFVSYSYSGADFQGVLAWDWMTNVGLLGDEGIQLKVGVDGIAAAMVLLTGIVILAGTWVSWKLEHRLKDFFILLYVLVAGVFGTFVMLDLFIWFLFYELAVLPMYLLIAVWGSTRKEYGAMKLMMMLVAASILIFTAIFAIFTEVGLGTFDMVTIFENTASIDRNTQLIMFPMVAIGCGNAGRHLPLPPLVAGRSRGRTDGRINAARRRADEAGRLRHHPPRLPDAAGRRGVLGAGPDRTRHHRRALRRDRGAAPD